MNKNLKKYFALVFLGLIILVPSVSHAIWGVGDVALDPVEDASGITEDIGQITQIADQVKSLLKEFGLDVIIYKVSEQLSQKLITKVLNKATGGASGDKAPLFVTNFSKYFQDISNKQIGTFTKSLNSSSNPFAKTISSGISNQAGGFAKSGLNAFSLNTALPSGVKWQDAANSIAKAGSQGWDFYGQLAQPQNSPLGAAIIAQSNLSDQIKAAQDIAKTELTSSGFKPAKADPSSDDSDDDSSAPECGSDSGQAAVSSLDSTDGDLCDSDSTAVGFATTSTGWSWSCTNNSGEADAECTADSSENGGAAPTCGSDSGQAAVSSLDSTDGDLCATGSTPVGFSTTATGWSWSCTNNSGSADAECTADSSQNGGAGPVCGSDSGASPTSSLDSSDGDLCADGSTPVGFTATTNGWSWSCTNNSGEADAECNAVSDGGANNNGSQVGQGDNGSDVGNDDNGDDVNGDDGSDDGSDVGDDNGDDGSDVGDDGGDDGEYSDVSDENIDTPSQTNEDQSNQTVTETFDRLRNADSFGKILFNAIQQMITKLIDKGFSKLNSNGAAPAPLYGGPQDVAKAQNGSWTSAPQQVVDLRNSLDDGITKTNLEIGFIESTINSVKTPVSDNSTFSDGTNSAKGTIMSLEACIPGPDTGWQTRLSDYMTEQTEATQKRAGDNGAKGEKNARALTAVQTDINQAVQEEEQLVSNSFLNIPGASAMQAALTDYYKKSATFGSLIDTLITKRQVLTSLQTLAGEAESAGTTANGGTPLILLDSQWNAMTPAHKLTLYNTLAPQIIANFPQYDATSTSTGGAPTLAPLTPDDPTTTDVDEHDQAMQQQVFDEQWNEWETKIPNATKQQLYAKYVSLTQDISDSSTVQNAQVASEAASSSNQELVKVLSDCKAIRAYLMANPNASSIDPTATQPPLQSTAVIASLTGPSILTATANGTNFISLNQRLIGSNGDEGGLQVTDLASNAGAILDQDSKEELFCRLMNNENTYWQPADLTGYPIPCSKSPLTTFYTLAQILLVPTGAYPNWYHTNSGEILSLVNPNGN